MSIKISNDGNTMDIYVYGTIKATTGWWSDSSTEFSTSNAVKNINDFKGDNINLYINSPGGEVFGTLNMIQALSECKATVTSYSNGGMMASAATLLHNAADKRVMDDKSLYMVHLPLSGARGNRIEIGKTLELLDAVEQMMLNMYLDRANVGKEELVTMLEKETWLSAQKALEYGFVDEIVKSSKKKAKAKVDNVTNSFTIEGFTYSFEDCYDVEETKKLLQEFIEEETTETQTQNEGGTEMSFSEIMSSLTDEQRAIIEAGISEQVKNEVAAQLAQVTNEATSTPAEDPVTAALANADPALVENYKQMQEMQKLMGQQLEAMRKEAAYNEFLSSLESYGNLPLQEDHKRALFNIKESCSSEYESLEALFKVANNAIESGMTPIGDPGHQAENVGTDLLSMVDKVRKENPEMSYADAMTKVVTEHPDLYDSYRNSVGE